MTTPEAVADKILKAIGGNDTATTDLIPYHPGNPAKPLKVGASWELLDGLVSGECDEHAELMSRAMRLLGVEATVTLIRASTDAEVTDVEQTEIDGKEVYLIMDFGADDDRPDVSPEDRNPNAFEATCETASKVYAVWPAVKGESRFDLYGKLPFQQSWVVTKKNIIPGETDKEGDYWAPVREYGRRVKKFGAPS